MLSRRNVIMGFSWGLLLAWMFLIFYLSAQPGGQSAELSNSIADRVVEIVEEVVGDTAINIDLFNHFIRKNAHFFAYLIMGTLSLNALRRSGMKGFKSTAIAIIICVLYAISDEVHQLYVPGRSGQFSDVLLDSTGALVGVALYQLIKKGA